MQAPGVGPLVTVVTVVLSAATFSCGGPVHEDSTSGCDKLPPRVATFDLTGEDAGSSADAGSTCQEFCARKTGEYVVSCRLVTVDGGSAGHPGVECTTKPYCM